MKKLVAKAGNPRIEILNYPFENLTNKYDDAKDAVTNEGMDVVKTSLIMGLATDINPIPPVHNMVDVENNSQN